MFPIPGLVAFQNMQNYCSLLRRYTLKTWIYQCRIHAAERPYSVEVSLVDWLSVLLVLRYQRFQPFCKQQSLLLISLLTELVYLLLVEEINLMGKGTLLCPQRSSCYPNDAHGVIINLRILLPVFNTSLSQKEMWSVGTLYQPIKFNFELRSLQSNFAFEHLRNSIPPHSSLSKCRNAT